MIEIDWFTQTPIDFEYKNYLLLDYLSKLDSSYSIHKLSPYLLWTEKLLNEIRIFENSFNKFQNSLRKEIINFSLTSGITYSTIDTPNEIKIILEVIEYSEPLLKSRIELGYKLFKKYPQLLY